MPKSDSIVASAELPQPAFVCSHTNSGRDAAWLHVAGELDIATTPQLAQTLRDAEPHARLIALDLGDVTFMDCSGVHVIVDASRRARDVGRRPSADSPARPPEHRPHVHADRAHRRRRDRRRRPGRAADSDAPRQSADARRALGLPPPQCRAPGPSLDPPSPGEVAAPQPSTEDRRAADRAPLVARRSRLRGPGKAAGASTDDVVPAARRGQFGEPLTGSSETT